MLTLRLQGIGNFTQAREKSGEARVKLSSPGFNGFAGQRPVRQRSISAVLNFWFFCFKTKELARRGNERHKATK
jgi:hypothetical protein